MEKSEDQGRQQFFGTLRGNCETMSSRKICEKPKIGIDLGTTFSCIAYYNNNEAKIIPDQCGDRLIKSFVYYDPETGEVSVGKMAYDLATNCPGNGLWDIKRIIGRKYDDQSLLKYKEKSQTQFTIVRGENDLAAFQVTIGGEQVIKTPEEVSAEILKHLKKGAATFLDKNISEVVISIPAYFSNAQRKATKKAAELAGLTVLKLITEPTAGAIHYTQNRNLNSKLLVFDWGGGTLDISLIQVYNKTFKVKAVFGDTLLGGRNIDEVLYKYFYVPITTRFHSTYVRRLLNECTTLKEQLSFKANVKKLIDTVNQEIVLSLTRDKFEDLTKDIFQRVSNIVEVGLYDSGWDKDDIDTVLLVGGSTRIPIVSDILTLLFNTDKIKTDLNPDEAVACGAAIQATLLIDNSESLEKYNITEVTPLSLGIIGDGNLFIKIIERNSNIPVSNQEEVRTVKNNQTESLIPISEGERKNCNYNNKLGEFCIKGLPPRRAGEVEIFIKFNLDEDGILTVTATEKGNCKNTETLVVTMGEFRLSEHKVDISIQEAQKLRKEDNIFEEFILEKIKLGKICRHILFDIEKIASKNEKDFVKNQCDQFLSGTEVLKFTDIEELTKMFNVMYDKISKTLITFNVSTMNTV